MKILNFMKKHWKSASAVCLILIATVIGVVIVKASTVSLTVNIASINFTEGQTSQGISASVSLSLDNDAAIIGWDWSVEDTEVATVSNNEGSGTVFSKGAGKTALNIMYSLTDGTSAKKTVPVTVPLVVSYEAVKGILSSGAYGTVSCNAATTKNVEWSSSNNNIVSVVKDVGVAPNGSVATITAVSGGTATITASIPSDSLSYSFQVTVGVKIVDDEITVNQNESKKIVTNSNSDADVYWWTENEEVATVVNGVVTGVYAGSTTVYGSCVEGEYLGNAGDYVTVTVPYVVSAPSTTALVGDQLLFTTTAKPSEVEFSSSNINVIYYDQSTGMFNAVGTGTADISVSWRGQTETITVNIIDGLSLSNTSISLNIGDSQKITATVSNTVNPVHWTIGDPNVASINVEEDGLSVTVKALSTGENGYTTLVATQEINGVIKSYSCKVNVLNPVNNLILMYNGKQIKNTISINKGDGIYITAYLNFGQSVVPDNTVLSWVSSDPSVISVSPTTTSGQQQLSEIKALNGGTATVTVVSEDGLFIATADFYVAEGVKDIKLDKEQVTAQMALEKYQLKATITPQTEGVDKTVIWSTLDPKVVTVDQNGLVTFVGPGETYISATSAADTSKVAYCNFIITQQVEGIKMDYPSVTLSVGDEYRLTYVISPSNATNQNVIFSSSNEGVVKVDPTGMLTAIGSGSATVIVQTEDGGYIDMTNVTVLQPVQEIVLSQTEVSVKKGTEFWLNATVLPESSDNKKITWTSSDKSLATVDQDGKVTTLKVGTVTISCVSEDTGVVAYCVVEITEPVTGLKLNSYYEEILTGTKFVIVPKITPINAPNKAVTYVSSDPEVATVDADGVVSGLNGGTCEIIVTTVESQLKATCTIVVKEYVSSIKINGSKDLINVGDELQLTAEVERINATNRAVVWSSSDTKIATVDQKGTVTAVSDGTVVITATAADGSGVSDSVKIKIINPVKEIILSDKKITIYEGDTYNLVATINPTDATMKELVWTSDDETVAKAYSNGDIVGMSPGRTIVHVTATDINKVVASCIVVVKPIIKASSVDINSSEIVMLKGKTRKLTARLYPTNSNESIRWLSTDTSIVQVDEYGNIITVGAGVCEVVAYSTYGTAQDSCKIYSIAMSHTDVKLEQYDKFNLYVDGSPSAVSWRTSNPRIATIKPNGEVTARMPGECIITATVAGKSVSSYIRVYPIDPKKFINTEQ